MPRELTTGEIISQRYMVASLHFLGGEATVYTGTDTTTNTSIIIKQLATEPGDSAGAERSASTALMSSMPSTASKKAVMFT